METRVKKANRTIAQLAWTALLSIAAIPLMALVEKLLPVIAPICETAILMLGVLAIAATSRFVWMSNRRTELRHATDETGDID